MASQLPLEPPREILKIQNELNKEEANENIIWNVVASKVKVLKDWRQLVLSCPENAIRCYEYLSSNPMQRRRGRIFPLKGQKFKGAWEYEITGSERVFYVPFPEEKKVVVYYAGKHPVKNKYPQPPPI